MDRLSAFLWSAAMGFLFVVAIPVVFFGILLAIAIFVFESLKAFVIMIFALAGVLLLAGIGWLIK